MSLSDKIVSLRCKSPTNDAAGIFDCTVIEVGKIKEAVRKLKEKIIQWDGQFLQTSDRRGILDKIDEIFGEKLI